jgi:hypothetical protein
MGEAEQKPLIECVVCLTSHLNHRSEQSVFIDPSIGGGNEDEGPYRQLIQKTLTEI